MYVYDEIHLMDMIVWPMYKQFVQMMYTGIKAHWIQLFAVESVSDLVICRISNQSGSCKGGDEIFLLCEKVNKGLTTAASLPISTSACNLSGTEFGLVWKYIFQYLSL